MQSLAHVTPDRLLSRLEELRGEERRILVEFLWHLAELDRRRLYLSLGYASLFAYCTERLGLSKSSAFRRTTAARLLARHPIVAEYLSSGRLCLTTLVQLKDLLDEDGDLTLLDRASGKTEEQVEELVAELRPRPAPMDFIRRLPTRTLTAGPGSTAMPAHPVLAPESVAEFEAQFGSGSPPQVTSPKPMTRPIAKDLYRMGLTIGREFKEELEEVQALLSHKIPDGDLEQVLLETLRIAKEELLKRKRGTERPRLMKTLPMGRRPSARVRREVYERDGGHCSFVGPDGTRCNSRYQLEFDHTLPVAKGGTGSPADGIRLLCRRHNLYMAEREFGARWMARFRKAPPAGSSP